MGENLKHGARFFPPKDLVYFWINTRHNSKAQTFFCHKQFSRRKTFANTFSLSFSRSKKRFSRQKTWFFSFLIAVGSFKSANL